MSYLCRFRWDAPRVVTPPPAEPGPRRVAQVCSLIEGHLGPHRSLANVTHPSGEDTPEPPLEAPADASAPDGDPYALRNAVGRWLRLRAQHASESPCGLATGGVRMDDTQARALYQQLAADAEHSWLLARLFAGEEPWPFEEWLERTGYTARPKPQAPGAQPSLSVPGDERGEPDPVAQPPDGDVRGEPRCACGHSYGEHEGILGVLTCGAQVMGTRCGCPGYSPLMASRASGEAGAQKEVAGLLRDERDEALPDLLCRAEVGWADAVARAELLERAARMALSRLVLARACMRTAVKHKDHEHLEAWLLAAETNDWFAEIDALLAVSPGRPAGTEAEA